MRGFCVDSATYVAINSSFVHPPTDYIRHV